MNYIIENISLVIPGTCIGMVNNSENLSSRPIIWKPIINILMPYQSYIDKINPH